MKRILGGAALTLVVCVVLLVSNRLLVADPPEIIRYQARLTDAAGVPLTGSHDLTFAIYGQETGGSALWTEGPLAVDLGGSGADILLGEVTPLTSSVLTAADRWLEVTVDGSILAPRQKLGSVPFALVADRLGVMTLSDVQSDMDARIAVHSALPVVHHVKTIDAAELSTGTLDVARLGADSVGADKIADGSGSGLDADVVDGFHASATPVGSQLLALDPNGRFPATALPPATTINVYDSGWFAVAEQDTNVLTHNLGATTLIAQLYFATDAAGSNMSTIYGSNFFGEQSFESGGNIQDITTTQLTVQAANGRGVARTLTSAGDAVNFASGFYRVIAIAIN